MRFSPLWKFVLLAVVLYFARGVAFADESAKLNEKAFKKGCVCTGESSNGGQMYEKVLVIAQMPGGGDYWVFYLDFLEERHRRYDRLLIPLRLPVEEFLENGKFRLGKHSKLQCPERYWSSESAVNASR